MCVDEDTLVTIDSWSGGGEGGGEGGGDNGGGAGGGGDDGGDSDGYDGGGEGEGARVHAYIVVIAGVAFVSTRWSNVSCWLSPVVFVGVACCRFQ